MDKTFVVLKAQSLDKVTAEIQLVPLGEYRDSEGKPFRVTEEDVLEIIANAAKKENDTVVDYEHQTLHGVEAPAAAWIRQLVNKGKDGLWAIAEWTERAKQYLDNREYRYLSPVLFCKKKDADGFARPSELHSAALTNTPAIDGMAPLVNKSPSGLAGDNKTKEGLMEKLMEEIKKTLGLKPEATDEEVLQALKDCVARCSEADKVVNKDVLDALGLKHGSTVSEAKGTILALKQAGTAVSAEEFKALKRKLEDKESDDLVTLALKDGKITAAQKDWAKNYALADAEGFKVFVAKAPVVVPMDGLPKGKGDGKGVLDEASAVVCKNLGISEELYKKHNNEKEE